MNRVPGAREAGLRRRKTGGYKIACKLLILAGAPPPWCMT